MEALMIILGMAGVTFLARYGLLAILSREMPPMVSRWLGYVPVAVFTALIFPGLLVNAQNKLQFGPEIAAGLVGLGVAWKTRQVLPTILAGMAAFWLARLVW